jgi:flagellar protein FliO/FliZ
MAMMDIAQYLLSFGLVIGLLLGLLWALKKLQSQGRVSRRGDSQRIQIVETLTLGVRQKLVLIQCDQHQVLLGVTPTEIRPLHQSESAPHTTEEWLRRRQS